MHRLDSRLTRAGASLLAAAAVLAAACDTNPTGLRETTDSLKAPTSASREVNVAPGQVSRVVLTYTLGVLDTTTYTLNIGRAAVFQATVYDQAGQVIVGAAVRYRSTNTTIMSVDSMTGHVRALAAGTAAVTGTSGGVTATTRTITVRDTTASSSTTTTTPTTTTSPTPTPTGGTQIPLTLRRFDGLSGAVMVSNGIPLTQGLVTSANLTQVHLLVNGVEQKVYVKPLFGHFADGSLRAILVQFNYSIPNATGIPATLVVNGTARTLGDLAARPAVQVPAAAALPTSPAYLVATKWGGKLYAPSVTPAPTSLLTQYEGDYVRLEAADWKLCGPSWNCNRTAGYDRALVTYQEWLRTGDPTYWYHATAEAANYLKSYIIPNQSPTPWWSMSEGVAVHYWATGDEVSRYQLRKIAETLAWQVRPGQTYSIVGTYGDDRMRAKALYAALDAAMLEISTQPADAANYYSLNGGTKYYAQFLTPTTLGTWITGILATQQTTTGHVGMFGGWQYGWGQSNYMVGMLLTGLIRYYDEITPDSRIRTAVKKCIDDMWMYEWSATSQGMEYNSMRGTLANSTTKPGPNYKPGLNGLVVPAFAWYSRVSGDATYMAKADKLLQGLTIDRNWWPNSGKAFDEAFYRIFNTFAWRAGM